uniref:uncharacterized protein LOC109972796 isoform X1 n=1 Tax=Monopterus albus TaxID=43700 RepID=UPI0009B38DAD|nr:uncharacterized protein LOC109972796 isoform X1 [Monopterus albus]
MKEVDHISTTTDCWSSRRWSFIGVTARWIDPDSLKRCSAALACKQLRSSHTFDVLASALNDIHSEFEIRGKIVRTTTDNGTNFLKAFQVFGEDENNSGDYADDDRSEEEEDQEGANDVEFVEVSALLNEDDGFEYQLLKHQCCACHLLNLIATVDAAKAVSSEGYKKLYHSTFAKCNAMWSKCGRSTLAAEKVEDVRSLQLLCPNATRWNSLFEAVERLLRIIRDKGEAAIRVICTGLNVPMFSPVEIAFLTEYAAVTSPVSQATNILQAEANIQMGWLLPTINLLITKPDRVKLPLNEQLDAYLACVADHMDLLKSFPAVCKLSVKLNTPLPASAACERLFSCAALVFSPRRARLDSCNFENQLLLRLNSKFFSFK